MTKRSSAGAAIVRRVFSVAAVLAAATPIIVGSGASSASALPFEDPLKAQLTLGAVVINDDGGQLGGSDFPLSVLFPDSSIAAQGTDTDSGLVTTLTPFPLDAGTYTLVDPGGAGYTANMWSCQGGTLLGTQLTLAAGEIADCVLLKDDIGPLLTLVKEVVNNDAGTAVNTDWVLDATSNTSGISVLSGQSGVSGSVRADSYTLSEIGGPAGYSGVWACDGGSLSGDQLTLALGQDVTCTITNDDDPQSTITLNKIVINDSGGTSGADAFTLTVLADDNSVAVTGVDTISSQATSLTPVVVAPGNYTLTETGPTGYAAGLWSCTGGTLVGNQLTIALGDHVTCTVTNDDLPSLGWVKVNSWTSEPLGGTSWVLTKLPEGTSVVVADCVLAPCTGPDVDASPGVFNVLGLTQGDYTVVEAGTLLGYRTNTTTYPVSIRSNLPIRFYLSIENIPTMVSWSKVGAGGGALGGTTWEIRSSDPAFTTLTVTDCTGEPCAGPDLDPAAGKFLVYYLPAGGYTLVETGVPDGYYLDPTEHPFTVDPAYQGTIAVTADPIINTLVRAVWRKVDEVNSGLLAGSKWTLTGPVDQVLVVTDCIAATAADCTGPDIDPIAGSFAVEGLTAGEWILTETKAPVGYRIATFSLTELISSSQPEFDFGTIDNFQDGQISWIKKDDAGAILGGASFQICEDLPEGWCFDLADNTGQAGYEGADEDPRPGYFLVTYLPFGDYLITETVAPEGYLMDTTTHTATALASATPVDAGVFVNVKKVYGLTLTKAANEVSGGELTPTDGIVNFGDVVSYQLTVTATGNSPETNITVTDVVPAGMTYVAGTADCLGGIPGCTATYDAITHTITWVIAELAAGDMAWLVFDATVDAAPDVAPGSTYTWQGDNVGAAMSTEVTTKVPSNLVTVTATTTVLPETGSNTTPIILIGLLAILLGGTLVVFTRRRETQHRPLAN